MVIIPSEPLNTFKQMKQYILMISFLSFNLGIICAQGKPNDDRKYRTGLLYRISEPVLRIMSRSEFVKNMKLELSPSWDGRDPSHTA